MFVVYSEPSVEVECYTCILCSLVVVIRATTAYVRSFVHIIRERKVKLRKPYTCRSARPLPNTSDSHAQEVLNI